MHGTCYLCGKVGDVARLPSGSNACILCIWQYLSDNNDQEGAEVVSSCNKECKECPKDNKEECKEDKPAEGHDWTADNIEIKEEEDGSYSLFPNWIP